MTRDEEIRWKRATSRLTLQQIGDLYGISKERVRQITKGIPKPRDERRPNREKSFEERFERSIEKDGDCWIWTGSKTLEGYGRINARRKNIGKYAHRLSWYSYNGPIPAGMHVFHYCENRACVNPQHLYLSFPHMYQSLRDDDWSSAL